MSPRTISSYFRFASKKEFLLIAFLFLFNLITNLIWLKQSTVIVNQDESFHFTTMLEDYMKLTDFKSFISDIHIANYEPVYQGTAFLFNRLFGPGLTAIKSSNSIWFLIMLLSTFLLTRLLFGTVTANWAVFILAFYPFIYGSSRMFREEFGLTAAVPLAVYFLYKSSSFSDLRYSLLFALSAGMGLMIKYPFWIFVFGPVLIQLYAIFTEQDLRKRKTSFLNLFTALLLILIIILPRHYDLYQFKGTILKDPFVEFTGKWYDFINTQPFTLGFIYYQLSPPMVILFLLGLKKVIKDTDIETKLSLLSWIFIPLVAFQAMPHRKLIRHILPYAPALAIVSAVYVSNLKSKTLKLLIISISILQFFSFSFGIGPKLQNIAVRLPGAKTLHYFLTDPMINNVSCHPPFKEKLYDDITRFILSDKNTVYKGLVVISSWAFTEEAFRIFFYTTNAKLDFHIYKSHESPLTLFENIKKMNYIAFSNLHGFKPDREHYIRLYDSLINGHLEFLVSPTDADILRSFKKFLKENGRQFKEDFIDELLKFDQLHVFYNKKNEAVYLVSKSKH